MSTVLARKNRFPIDRYAGNPTKDGILLVQAIANQSMNSTNGESSCGDGLAAEMDLRRYFIFDPTFIFSNF